MVEKMLTGRAKLAQGSSIAPGNRSASWPELDCRDGRHVVTEYGFFELDRKGDPQRLFPIPCVGADIEFLKGRDTGMSIQR